MEEKIPSNEKNGYLPSKPDFKFFITTLAIQASINLGVLENPLTNKKQENMPQAKLLIDTLEMLQEKTRGNLNKEETDSLNNILAELNAQYTSKVNRTHQ